jgi:hypothetical protein
MSGGLNRSFLDEEDIVRHLRSPPLLDFRRVETIATPTNCAGATPQASSSKHNA